MIDKMIYFRQNFYSAEKNNQNIFVKILNLFSYFRFDYFSNLSEVVLVPYVYCSKQYDRRFENFALFSEFRILLPIKENKMKPFYDIN